MQFPTVRLELAPFSGVRVHALCVIVYMDQVLFWASSELASMDAQDCMALASETDDAFERSRKMAVLFLELKSPMNSCRFASVDVLPRKMNMKTVKLASAIMAQRKATPRICPVLGTLNLIVENI